MKTQKTITLLTWFSQDGGCFSSTLCGLCDPIFYFYFRTLRICLQQQFHCTFIAVGLIQVCFHAGTYLLGKKPTNLNPYWHKYLRTIRPQWCFVTTSCLERFMSSGTLSFSGAVPVTFEDMVCFEILLEMKQFTG